VRAAQLVAAPDAHRSRGPLRAGERPKSLGRPVRHDRKRRYPGIVSDAFSEGAQSVQLLILIGIAISAPIVGLTVAYGIPAGIALLAAYVLAWYLIRRRARRKSERIARRLFE